MQTNGTSYEKFARLLEYPGEDWTAPLTGMQGSAAFEKFLAGIRSTSLSDLQELYTRTFDLNPVCALEIGYHLFGENYKRGEFLAHLRETEASFELGQDEQLPDYLPVLLRLLTKLEEEELRLSLITECLIPGIEKIRRGLKETDNPYRHLLEAVKETLQSEAPVIVPSAPQSFMRASLPVIDAATIEARKKFFMMES